MTNGDAAALFAAGLAHPMNDPIRIAQRKVMEGLLDLIPAEDAERTDEASFPHLRWMMEHCISQNDVMPVDKVGRWLGFVQGILHVRGIQSSRVERDRTRPIFHAAYAAAGLAIPATRERI